MAGKRYRRGSVGGEKLDRLSLMAAESLNRLVDGEQVPANDGGVDLTGAHRPKSPAEIRAEWALSIFCNCAT